MARSNRHKRRHTARSNRTTATASRSFFATSRRKMTDRISAASPSKASSDQQTRNGTFRHEKMNVDQEASQDSELPDLPEQELQTRPSPFSNEDESMSVVLPAESDAAVQDRRSHFEEVLGPRPVRPKVLWPEQLAMIPKITSETEGIADCVRKKLAKSDPLQPDLRPDLPNFGISIAWYGSCWFETDRSLCERTLYLQTGEEVMVLAKTENDWFLCGVRNGNIGYVHGAWLEPRAEYADQSSPDAPVILNGHNLMWREDRLFFKEKVMEGDVEVEYVLNLKEYKELLGVPKERKARFICVVPEKHPRHPSIVTWTEDGHGSLVGKLDGEVLMHTPTDAELPVRMVKTDIEPVNNSMLTMKQGYKVRVYDIYNSVGSYRSVPDILGKGLCEETGKVGLFLARLTGGYTWNKGEEYEIVGDLELFDYA